MAQEKDAGYSCGADYNEFKKRVKDEDYALTPIDTGEQRCPAGHFWGAGVRPCFLVHYVVSGKGVFFAGTKRYQLKKGQMFFIFPDSIVKYVADNEDPWHYVWVSFTGKAALKFLSDAGIDMQHPVITPKRSDDILSVIRSMPRERSEKASHNLHFTSMLYEFMSLIVSEGDGIESRENVYFSAAKRYIKAHYMEDITVDGIAEHLGISRKYLFAIFKSASGKSVQNYIIDYRMKEACRLLHDPTLPIGNVAYSVGYKDQLTFSKTFRSKQGVSPTEYRKGCIDV